MRTDRELRRPSEGAAEPVPVPAARREGKRWFAVARWLEYNRETGHRNETFSSRLESRTPEGLADCRAELRARYADRSEFRILEFALDLATGRERELTAGPPVSIDRGREHVAALRASLHGEPPAPADQDPADDGEPF